MDDAVQGVRSDGEGACSRSGSRYGLWDFTECVVAAGASAGSKWVGLSFARVIRSLSHCKSAS